MAGLTGTWSPCGFSMIDTVAAGTRSGRPRLTGAACVSFGAGALVGGIALFAGLAALGSLLGGAGLGPPPLAAAGMAAAFAVADLAGMPVRPQVRRQVPQHWRRVAPLPLATFGYGVLLGLGFTTFVLSLAVPALAALALMLGDPALGLLIGASFGVGRALPVMGIAPVADAAPGVRAVELMAERPATLRGLRVAGALALAACALSLAAEPARAATTVARPATDPSAGDGWLAWQVPGGHGILRLGAAARPLPGRAPALGPGVLASIEGQDVVVLRRLSDLEPIFARSLPGVDKLAVTSSWLVARERLGAGERIVALPLGAPAAPLWTVAVARAGEQLGRPAAHGDRVVWHATARSSSRIVEVSLSTGRRRTLLRDRGGLLLHPSIDGRRMLYVHVGTCSQRVMLRSGRRTRVLARRRPTAGTDRGRERGRTRRGSGTGPCPHRKAGELLLWTTALDGRSAYVAFIRPDARFVTRAALVRFGIG